MRPDRGFILRDTAKTPFLRTRIGSEKDAAAQDPEAFYTWS